MDFLQEINPFSNVRTALKRASSETGVDFDYLMKTAERESSLNPQARARTSSATGLFQFIEQTWLATLKQDGPAHGLGDMAAKISQTRDGRYVVNDRNARQEILNLRSDPNVSAVMAGAFTRRNGDMLNRGLGRAPTEGELYMAHFMGGQGALRLIQISTNKPDARAADYFPREARANRSIFYARGGRPRSVSEVYQVLAARHGNQPVQIAATRVRDSATQAISTQEQAQRTLAAAEPPREPQPFTANRGSDGPVFNDMYGTNSAIASRVTDQDFVSVWGSAREAQAAVDARRLAAERASAELAARQVSTPQIAARSEPAQQVQIASQAQSQSQAQAQALPRPTPEQARAAEAALENAPIPPRRPYFPASQTELAQLRALGAIANLAVAQIGSAQLVRESAQAMSAKEAPLQEEERAEIEPKAEQPGAIRGLHRGSAIDFEKLGAIGLPIDLAELTPGVWQRKAQDGR